MKIALVFDWLDDKGGMEIVNENLAKIFPESPIFTSVYDEEKFPELKHRVKISWLQKLPKFLRPKHQFLAPFMPNAFEKFDLKEFDLVIISASSGFSKCVKKVRENQKFICYCHTPIRYLYHDKTEYLENYKLPFLLQPFKFLLPKLLKYLEKKDQNSAQKIDHWISNSKFVGQRIKKFYKQSYTTIYPGIDTKKFNNKNQNGNYFLSVGRFIPYKKFDLLVRTFAKNKLNLKLAGVGVELKKCKKIAKKLKAKNIKFLEFVKTENLTKLYQNSRAFIFPVCEDFGLTPLESMASGKPVIYFNSGGAVESVGDFGISFDLQTEKSLQKAIDSFLKTEKVWQKKSEEIKKHSQTFDEKNFRENILKFIKTKI